MNRTLKFGLLIAIVLGTLGWLAIGGDATTASYYKTIAEIEQLTPDQKDKRIRVAGNIQAGSIKRSGREVSFVLVEEGRKMPVLYNGVDPLPDTFRDGAQALADGRVATDGVFHANKIAAKCASKYQAKPGEKYQKQLPVNQKRA